LGRFKNLHVAAAPTYANFGAYFVEVELNWVVVVDLKITDTFEVRGNVVKKTLPLKDHIANLSLKTRVAIDQIAWVSRNSDLLGPY
jgi:drug/metabolite transporter superfamily protein YnfA